MAKTFDGPPTLERSGSEHRRAVTSFLLRRKAWLEVELSLQERRRGRKVSTEGGYILSLRARERLGERGGAFLNGKEGRVGFRKKTLSVLVHIIIILLILPRSNMIHPFLVLEIPLHSFFNTLLKLERWLPAEFHLQLSRVEGILVHKPISTYPNNI